MSREARLKATAAALNPRGLDLTQFRQRSSREESLKVREDSAAGALAFAALDRFEDAKGRAVAADNPAGARHPGDPLAALLVRLKYGRHFSRPVFVEAVQRLIERHGGARESPTPAIRDAVAAAALFEWIHDACPRCRGARGAQLEPCPDRCDRGRVGRGGLRERLQVKRRRNRKDWRHPSIDQAMLLGAMPEEAWLGVNFGPCPTCAGVGYRIRKTEQKRGMQCSHCSNSGVVEFSPRKRFALVATSPGAGKLTYRQFLNNWHKLYYRLLEALQFDDRRISQDLVFGYRPARRNCEWTPLHSQIPGDRIRAIESGIEKDHNAVTPTERVETGGDAVGQPSTKSLQEPAGEVSPKDS